MVLEFLGCMIVAAVMLVALWYFAIEFFERRLLKKIRAICMLHDSIYPLIDDNFNDDNSMKVSVKLEYCGCKIKFQSGLEAALKIEKLLHRALKNYDIVKWLISGIVDESERLMIEDVKEFAEEMCNEMRVVINQYSQE